LGIVISTGKALLSRPAAGATKLTRPVEEDTGQRVGRQLGRLAIGYGADVALRNVHADFHGGQFAQPGTAASLPWHTPALDEAVGDLSGNWALDAASVKLHLGLVPGDAGQFLAGPDVFVIVD
jgi:hypothetical protein